jgi:hypothetical protein
LHRNLQSGGEAVSTDPDLVWNIGELKELVRLRHGDDHSEKVWEPVQSVAFRIQMAHYHATECERLTHNPDGAPLEDAGPGAFLKAALECVGAGSQAAKRQLALFAAEAHALASAQAAHACLDMFAHVLYWGMAMDQVQRLREKEISFSTVLTLMQRDANASSVVTLADALYRAPQTAYLAAYVNTVKHRRLIRANPSVRFEDEPGHGLRINSFSYDAKTHGGRFAEKWVREFLFEDNVYVLQSMVRTGNALTRLLR